MTWTEERLQDALHASAGRVRDDRLRPLPVLEPRAEPGTGPRAAWRGWLVPAAAAVGVVLVIGLVMAMTGGPRSASRNGSTTASGAPVTAASVPRYYVAFTGSIENQSVAVHATATGAVIATLPGPKIAGGWAIGNALAAAPGDRTFYAEYQVASGVLGQTWIYRFSILGSGSVTPMTRIKGGVISDATGLGNAADLAVSPDGRELALIADSTADLSVYTTSYADTIIVINLETGEHSVWQGGMARAGKAFMIANLSWAADGHSLVFLALWCDGPIGVLGIGTICSGADVSRGYRYTQVWSLSTATRGGALNSGELLLTQSARYPAIAQALAGPGGSDITAVVMSGRAYASGAWQNLAIDHISAAGGSLLGVDYHRNNVPVAEGVAEEIGLTADPSGRYVLLTYPGPGENHIGWIGGGKFHPLPFAHYDGAAVAW